MGETAVPVFGVPVSLPREGYRARQLRLIAAGRHPHTGLPLAGNGERCGTCRHLDPPAGVNSFHKCAVGQVSMSAATDVRVSWDACTRWEAVAHA